MSPRSTLPAYRRCITRRPVIVPGIRGYLGDVRSLLPRPVGGTSPRVCPDSCGARVDERRAVSPGGGAALTAVAAFVEDQGPLEGLVSLGTLVPVLVEASVVHWWAEECGAVSLSGEQVWLDCCGRGGG
jgi:hypothetical protein